MKYFTNDIYRFSNKSKITLFLISATVFAGFTWPFYVQSQNSAQFAQYFFWAAVPGSIFLLIAQLSDTGLDAKSVALLGTLAALLAALRPLGAGAVGLEPMWFLLILAARVFGSAFGFLLGVLGMFASALLTGGFGPWLAYQIFAAGLVGLFAGSFPQRFKGRAEILLLVVIAIFSSLLFGLLMDLQFWPWALGGDTQLSFQPGAPIFENLNRFLTFHFVSSMAWDIPRAVLTATLIVITAPAVLSALRRTKTKAAFLTPVEFSARLK
jgi:energy-coupling factor transport system substrate-specific component